MIRRAFLFGELRVAEMDGAKQALTARTQDTRRLFALLALSTQPQRREVLGASLWPDTPDEVRRARLRYSLVMLRRAIGNESLIVVGGDSVALAPEIQLDVRQFWELVQEAVVSPDIEVRIETLKEALRLAHRPLLEGWKELWVARERSRLEACRQDVLRALRSDLIVLGRESEAALWRHLVPANDSPTHGE